MMFVRPERMNLAGGTAGQSNLLNASLVRRDLEGPFVNLFLNSPDGSEIAVHMTNDRDDWRSPEGDIPVGFKREDVLVLRSGDMARE